MLRTRTRSVRMEGTAESTELWQHPFGLKSFGVPLRCSAWKFFDANWYEGNWDFFVTFCKTASVSFGAFNMEAACFGLASPRMNEKDFAFLKRPENTKTEIKLIFCDVYEKVNIWKFIFAAVHCSVTRWKIYFFSTCLFTPIKICPKAFKICQSTFKIMSNT